MFLALISPPPSSIQAGGATPLRRIVCGRTGGNTGRSIMNATECGSSSPGESLNRQHVNPGCEVQR